MPEQPVHHPTFIARGDQPLVGVITEEDGQEVVRYYTEDEPETSLRKQQIQRALLLAGAWGDVDWDETVEALDRIRHESKPTPPIDLDL
jgi:hypothetical protein